MFIFLFFSIKLVQCTEHSSRALWMSYDLIIINDDKIEYLFAKKTCKICNNMYLRTLWNYNSYYQNLVFHLEQATLYLSQSMMQPTLLWWSCRTLVRTYTLEAPDRWCWTDPSLLNLRTTSLLQAWALQPWSCAYLSWGLRVKEVTLIWVGILTLDSYRAPAHLGWIISISCTRIQKIHFTR